MNIRIRMSDGITINLDPNEKRTLKEVADEIGLALHNGVLVNIERRDGHARFVNPAQILYVEMIP